MNKINAENDEKTTNHTAVFDVNAREVLAQFFDVLIEIDCGNSGESRIYKAWKEMEYAG